MYSHPRGGRGTDRAVGGETNGEVSLSGKEIGAIIGVGTVSVAALTALGAYVFKKYRAKYAKKTPTDTKQEINPENDFSVDIEGKSLI